jgi:polyhydroxyalkanoate synthase
MQRILSPTGAVRAEERPQTASFDLPLHASIARLTAGVSPAALGLAWADWVQHLAFSPDKQLEIVSKALRGSATFAQFCLRASLARVGEAIEPKPPDKRFAGSSWQRWPFNAAVVGFLPAQDWWEAATTEVRGVSRHHEEVVSFVARQLLNMVSPANFLTTNPEVLDECDRLLAAYLQEDSMT